MTHGPERAAGTGERADPARAPRLSLVDSSPQLSLPQNPAS
jgi:hypothetical protein